MERFIDSLLLGIENRGTHATGFVAVTKDQEFVLEKKDIAASSFIKTRRRLPIGTRAVLCHTRWWTKGDPSIFNNNHPVNVGTTFVTHNGHIRNDDAIFKKLDVARNAEVDSEAIAATLYKHGFDKAEEALGMLSGGWAIAAVDPIKSPGEVLLVKGPSYPLIVHESKNFLVWGSTKDAILGAWTTVLGTPPTKGFKDLMFSEAVRMKDGEISIEKLSLKYNMPSSYNNNSYDEYGWTDEDDLYWGAPTHKIQRNTRTAKRSSGTFTILDQKDEIAELEKTGGARVVSWDNRDSMSDNVKRYHTGRWKTCPHCLRTVPEICTWDAIVYGLICEDCYNLATDKAPETRGVTSEVTEPPFQTKYNKEELETLTNWAHTSNWVHWAAVNKLRDETGLSNGLIDYVLFRVEQSALQNNDKLMDLYVKLHDSYWSAIEQAWDDWAEEWEAEYGEKQPPDTMDGTDYEIEVSQDGTQTLWITCASGTHKASEKCEACDAMAAASCGTSCEQKYCTRTTTSNTCPGCFRCAGAEGSGSSTIQHTLRKKLCPHGFLNSMLCPFCKKETEKPAPEELHALCMTPRCKKQARIYVGVNGWCKRHFDKCATPRCSNPPKGALRDGRRACHVHMRGQKGGTFDGDKHRIAKMTGTP